MSCEIKVWLKNAEKGIEIVSMTDKKLGEALMLMREAFYTDEPPAKGVRLQEFPEAIDELETLTRETFNDRVSVMALQEGRVIGALFNKVQEVTPPGQVGYFEHFKNFKCKNDTAKEYIDCMIRMDTKKDVFEHYGVDRSLEVMFLAVSRTARGQGVGRMLVKAAVEVARELNLPLVSAIFTSRASQSIGRALNWDQLVTVPMSEHVFKGTPYSVYTGEDQTQILMAYKLSDT